VFAGPRRGCHFPRYRLGVEDETLLEINSRYHETIRQFLETRNLLTPLPEKETSQDWPFSTVAVDEQLGFVLNIDHIMKNGEFIEQSKNPDVLFAVNGRNALAYMLERTGKSKATITGYFGVRYAEGDVARYRQRIDLFMGHLWNVAFRCPFCEDTENIRELYVSYSCSAFGCISCHTALDAKEAARYEHTRQATARAPKGGAQ
jgi:ribosomal protein L37AE/L43A